MTTPVRLCPFLLLLPACSVPEPAGHSQPVHEIIDESKVPVPMQDGVNLAAHVYRPDAPGKVYEYKISLWETSYVFKAGHRIRLEISSSNFPRFARNQNIGEPLGTSGEIVVAKQTVYHNAQYPSHLVLPVIPAGSRN